MMSHDEKILARPLLGEVFEFQIDIVVLFDVVISRVSRRLPPIGEQPLRVEGHEPKVVGEPDLVRPREPVVGHKHVAAVQCSFHERFDSGYGHPSDVVVSSPIVLTGNEHDPSLEVAHDVNQLEEPGFRFKTAHRARVRHAATWKQIAEEHHGRVGSRRGELGREQRQRWGKLV